MPDPIKDLYNSVKGNGLFLDENDFRQQLKKNPKDVYSTVSNIFIDYNEFEDLLGFKKKDGGAKPPISSSQYVSPLPKEELPLGIPQPKRSVNQEAQAAREKVDKTISDSDDILTRLIRENRLSAFELQQQATPQLDGVPNPAIQSAKRFLITQSPVTPDEVTSKKQEAMSDDKTAREVLRRVAKKDPTIASSAYILDAQARAEEDPDKEAQILANADKIARGELNYNINRGILQQPQGAIESGIRGFKERSRQLEDYDKIVNSKTPEDKIKILEEGFASYDPDRPIPIAEGASAQFAEMFGMEGIPMLKGATAATITGLIPGAQPAAPLVAAFAASPEYYKRSYESGLRSAYYELRQRGKTPEEALAIAEDQAQREGVIGAAEGAVSSALGARIGFKPSSIVASPVMKNALERAVIASGNVIKQMAPEAAADAGAAGLLQIASNIAARDNGLDRDLFEGVQENIAGEVLFTVGMGSLTKAGRKLVDPGTYRTILNGFSRQPKESTDAKLGEMIVTGAMTPEEAVEVSRALERERGLDAQIPKTVPESARPQIAEMVSKRNELKQQLASANEAFHPSIKEQINSIDQQILSYATNESQVQEGRTEGDLVQPAGTVQGQQEEGKGAGTGREATQPQANVSDSDLRRQGAVVSLAPFFDTTIKTSADAKTIRESPEYKKYIESIPIVANAFGLNVNIIKDTIGGFENKQGNKIVEVSNRVIVTSSDLNQVEKFGAIMGTMTPETQEATIAARYITEEEKASIPPNEYVEELTIRVDDVDKTIESLQEAGIYDFTINESDNTVSFLDFSQGKDTEFDSKITNFESALQKRNVQYEEAGRSSVQSKYISPERRAELIAEIESDAAGLQQGGPEFRAIIAEAKQRDKAFRGELTKELTQELVTDPISKATQSLKSTGVSIDLIEDPAEYDAQVEQLGGQRGTEGVFLSNEGKILLNKSKLNDAITAGRIVWHESSHPVINIVRNTNPELYNRVISGMKASDNPAVQRAIQWANDNYQGQGVIDDESIVEAIAMVADGTLDLNTVPTGLKQSIIDFINLIARALGFNQVLNDTDVAAFKKLAGQVADVLTSGRDVAEVVGRENVSNFDSGRLQARGTQTDNSPAFFENIKDFANKSSFANKVAFKEAVQEKLKSFIPELKKIYGRKFDPSVYNEDTRKYLYDVLTKEASNAIAAHPEAIGWYDEKTQSALAAISAIHPEIATDMEARGAFILPLAVMSNGNKVDKNFDYAEEQYRVYKDTGRYNPNGDFGAQQVGIKKSLKLINALLDNGLTMSEVSNFLTSKHKAGDLKYRKPDGKLGDLVSGELATEDVYGAVILGPKIGNGFYMNLWGEFDQLTMDRWFMRTWGRLTGTLIERDKDLISNGKKRIASAIQNIKSDKEALNILKSAIGPVSGRSGSDIANAIEKVSAKKDVRNLLSSNEKTDEIRKAGNGLAKLLRGEKESPSNGEERKFIRNVFSDVQRRLSEESGVNITMADLQAVMWYPEKILYESFKEGESFEGASEGYTEDSAPDYFNAAKKIAKKLGATDEQINQAVSEGRRYSAERTGRRDTSTGEAVSRNDQEVLRQIRQIKGGAADLTKRSRPQASVGNREIINGFYSPIEDRINTFKQPKASVQKWKEIVGVKSDEAVFSGMSDWLGGKKPDQQLSKEEVLQFMKDNRIEIKEVVKGKGGKMSQSQMDDVYNGVREQLANMDMIDDVDGVRNNPLDVWYNDPTDDNYEALGEFAEERGIDLNFIADAENDGTKYSKYQLPGGENYKEVLITLPNGNKQKQIQELESFRQELKDKYGDGFKGSQLTDKEVDRLQELKQKAEPSKDKFKSSHFDESNIITHLRMNTRTDADGNKVLFLEEVQSDWGQKGKREGFAVNKNIKAKKNSDGFWDVYDGNNLLDADVRASSESDAVEFVMKDYELAGVPSAPYVTNTNAWVKLGLKVALKEAVKQGADRIAWTTGEQQNERYDLSKQVDEIGYTYMPSKNTYRIVAGKNREPRFNEELKENELESNFGKDVAEKIVSNKESAVGSMKFLRGQDLKVGGKGMKAFYGDVKNPGIVANVAKALVKELTGKSADIVESNIDISAPIAKQKFRVENDPNLPMGRTWVVLDSEGQVRARETNRTDAMNAMRELTNRSEDAKAKGQKVQPAIDITPELSYAVTGGMPQFSVGNRPENNPNFKLGAFVMRKKAEGATDGEIAIAIASVTGMKPEDIKTLIDNPEQYIRDMFPSMTKLQQDNLIEKAKIQNIYRGRQFGKPIDKAFTGLEVPQEYVDEYMEKTAKSDNSVKQWATDFKRKWLDPAKGLPDWVLAIKDFASGSKNIEIARASKTIERLKDEAKKIGFTDWDAFGKALVVAKDVKRYIPNEDGVVPFDAYRAAAGKMFTTPDDMLPAVVPDEIKALPDEIIPYVYAMRGQIDNLTRDLIGYGYVTPEQAVNLENNIGQYVNRSYRLFNEMGYKPEPEVMNAAIKFLADDYVKKLATDKVGAVADQRIYEEAIDLAKKDVDAILNKKKNPYFNASVDRRNTGVLQERQDIPAPLRKLMGEYTDPGTVFMMTVAKQAALKGSSQYLNKLRENGMGTLFFEQNDPSRPASHSVQIAAAGTESMNPLGGLFTTPEIAEAIEMAEPTYNELTQAWMKLVGAVRWGKTVGSVATQFKNFESNMGFAVLNGYLMSGQNTPAFKAAGKYVKGQYSKAEIDAITEKAIKLNLVGQSVGARELKEMLGSGDVHDIALDIALSPEGKWGKKVAKKLNIFKEANKLYRLGDDFWKVYAYMTEREQLSDARFSSKYEDLTKEQQEQIDVESSERVKNTWPTYDRVIEGAKFVSKRAPIFGNFISFQAESLRVLANSIKLAKQDMADPQLRHLGVRRAVGIAAYFGLRSAITIGLAKMAGFAAAGVLGAAFGDDEEERNKRAIKQALPPFMRTSDLAVIRTKEPHKFTVISLSSLDPYAIIPNSLNAYTEGREGIFGKTMDPGVGAATAELFSAFLEPEMTFSTMWSVMNNIDPKTKQEIVLSSDSDVQAAAKIGGKAWDMLEPSSVALVQRFFERKDKEAEILALGGARPYDVDLHKSFGYILSQFGKDVDAINREYNSLKYRDIPQNEKNAAEMAAEDKKAFAISKLNETYRDFINLGADPKVLNDLINQRSSIKMTGFDKNTKKFIKTGNINKKTLFK